MKKFLGMKMPKWMPTFEEQLKENNRVKKLRVK